MTQHHQSPHAPKTGHRSGKTKHATGSRRRTLGVLVTAACITTGASLAQGANGTIKIAAVLPSSGSFVTNANEVFKGWQIAAEQANATGGVDGFAVELTRKDTDATPANSVRAVRQAVSQDGAKFVTLQTSSENVAVNQQLAGLHALSFNAVGTDDALTGSSCVPNAFRTLASDSMLISSVAQVVPSLPGTKWSTITIDSGQGHNATKVFTVAAQANNKPVVLSQFSPQGTSEFGSYISKIQSSGADAVYVEVSGADGVAFVNQATQFNLFGSVKTVLSKGMITERVFPVLGDKILGQYASVQYDAQDENPTNKAFVAAYTKRYGEAPSIYAANAYIAAETLFAGVTKAHDIEPEKVRDALNDLTFDSIDGPVTMRAADHQLLRRTFVAQVVKSPDGLAFKIVNRSPPSETTPQPNPECKMR